MSKAPSRKTALNHLSDIQGLLGPEVVLLPIPSGAKGTTKSKWQKVTVADTEKPQYQAELLQGNIGVSLGAPSSGLCTLDFDDDDAGQMFLEKNPRLKSSLRTKGARGFNVWVKIKGDYPPPVKLTTRATGEPVGEWRATGNYTVIHGRHPSGVDYQRLVDAPPVEIAYDELVWPVEIVPPQTTKVLPRSSGRPLSEAILENRRKIVNSILDMTWDDATHGFCTCPGQSKHTGKDGSRDCMVSLDGVPTVYCFHHSCHEEVEQINSDLRNRVRAQEVIVLPNGHTKMQDAAAQLFEILKATKQFYIRGQTVCEIATTEFGAALRPVDKVRAAATWENHTTFGRQTFKDGEPRISLTLLPEGDAARFLATDEVRVLPKVEGVVTCPVLYRDSTTGSLRIHQDGYNHDTKLYVSNPTGELLPTVSLPEAVEAIRDLVGDFHFESDSHRSRAIMSFITPALVFSGLLGGRPPMDVAEADSSQAGKGFRHKMICAIYNDSPSIVAQRKGGVGGLDESFQEALIRGRPFIALDNIRGNLDSQYIEAFLTAPSTIGARGFGRAEVEVRAAGFILLLSSNDLKLTEDMANRSSVVRIRKRPDGYEWKRYGPKQVFVDQWLVENQRFYLACVYRIVQEWYRRGCPELRPHGHDFRWWAGKGEFIIQEIFGEPSMLEGHRQIQKRAREPRLGWLQRVAIEVEGAGRLNEPLAMVDLLDICDHADIPAYRRAGHENRDFADQPQELSYLGSQFGLLFKKAKGLIILDGYAVNSDKGKFRREREDRAVVVSTYTFQRVNGPPPQMHTTDAAHSGPLPRDFADLPDLGIDDVSPDERSFVGAERVSQPADIVVGVDGLN